MNRKKIGIILVILSLLLLLPITTHAAPPVTPTTGMSNSEIAYNFFIAKGYSPVAAAAICGNLHHESMGMDPTLLEIREGEGIRHSLDMEDGRGYGLAQWTYSDRQEPLRKLAKERGTSVGDLLTQLEYVDQELKQGIGRKATDINFLNAFTDVISATKYFMDCYEGPRDDVANLAARIALASAYLATKGKNLPGAAVYDFASSVYGVLFKTLNIDWDSLTTLGKELGEQIERIATQCKNAIGLLDSHAIWLLWTLATLDLTIYLSFTVGAVGAEEIIRTTCIKFIKYSFFYLLINNWKDILNMFCIGLFDNGAVMVTGNSKIAEIITNPEVLMRANIAHANPSFDYFASTNILNIFMNLPITILHFLMIALILGLSIYLAIITAIYYLEFMTSAGLAVFTIPFGISKYMKFLPEGLIGSVVSTTLKLFCLGFMIDLLGNILKTIEYTSAPVSMLKFLVCFVIAIYLITTIPSKFANAIGGKIELK